MNKIIIKFSNRLLSYSKSFKLKKIIKKIKRKYPIVKPLIPSIKFEPFLRTSKQKVTKRIFTSGIFNHWSKISILV